MKKIYGKERPFIEAAAFDEEVFQAELDLINSEGNLFSILNYVKNEHKTKNVYVSGYMCDPEMAAEEFYIAKEKNLVALGKTLEHDLGNQAFHIVQSFPDGLDISDNKVHSCSMYEDLYQLQI